MLFYVFFSAVVVLAAVVGCIVIWGYDAVRADRSEVDVREATRTGLTPEARRLIAARHSD
ncbi:hypothetical protein GCM10027270_33380 [Nocardioides ginkgobilobae]